MQEALKDNNYRAWGNIFDVTRDVSAGYASGTLRTGVWWERGDNWRIQEYISLTTRPAFSRAVSCLNESMGIPESGEV
ncbi:MAG TPA: hypothetical protein VNR65_05360 [Geobacterales bacterium]|nr:hypothetical protein [Geobacterales bacterium]